MYSNRAVFKPNLVCMMASIILILPAYSVSAEEQEKKQPPSQVTKLAEVIVREKASDNGTGTTVSKEDIDRIAPTHISDLLEGEPGVQTHTSYYRPTVAVNIRGVQGHGRVNLSVDGMRQNYQVSGHGERNGEALTDPQRLTGVDIHRGTSSGLGGAGVIGGIANFRTLNTWDLLKGGEDIGGLVRITGGLGKYKNGVDPGGLIAFSARPFSTLDFTVASTKTDQDDYKVGMRGDGLKIDGKPQHFYNLDEDGTLKSSGKSMTSNLVKGNWDVDSQNSLGLSYLETEAEFWNSAESAGSTAEPVKRKMQNHSYALDYLWASADERTDIATKIYQTTTHETQKKKDLSYPVIKREFETETLGLNLDAHHNSEFFGYGAQWNAGMELFRDKVMPTSSKESDEFFGTTPPGERLFGGLFANASVDFSPVRADIGLRYDHYRLKGDAVVQEGLSINKDKGAFSPSLMLTWSLNQHIDLYTKAAYAWRPPSVTETLVSGNHGGASPNPFLEPERTFSKELGANLHFNSLLTVSDSLNIHLGVYDNEVEDMIVARFMKATEAAVDAGINSGYVTPYVNLPGKTRVKGAELMVSYDANRWYTSLGASVVKVDIDQSACAVDNGNPYFKPIPADELPSGNSQCLILQSSFASQPTLNGKLGFRAFDRKLDAGIDFQYVGNPDDTETDFANSGWYMDPDNNEIPDDRKYTLWNLYAGYQPLEDLNLSLTLKNLRDTRYVLPMGTYSSESMGPGRTLIGKVEYRF